MCLCGDNNNNNMCFTPLEKMPGKKSLDKNAFSNKPNRTGDHIVYRLCWSTLRVKGALVVIILGQQV